MTRQTFLLISSWSISIFALGSLVYCSSEKKRTVAAEREIMEMHFEIDALKRKNSELASMNSYYHGQLDSLNTYRAELARVEEENARLRALMGGAKPAATQTASKHNRYTDYFIGSSVNQTPDALKLSPVKAPHVSANSINIFNPFTNDVIVVIVENETSQPLIIKSGEALTLKNSDSYLCLIANLRKENLYYKNLERSKKYDIEWNSQEKKFYLIDSHYLKPLN